jgi:hypothetical protein
MASSTATARPSKKTVTKNLRRSALAVPSNLANYQYRGAKYTAAQEADEIRAVSNSLMRSASARIGGKDTGAPEAMR